MVCKDCSDDKKRALYISNKEKFLIKLYKKFPDRKIKFDYIKSIYVNSKTPMEIYCNVCGNYFSQRPASHLGGCGCSICAKNSLKTQEEIIIRFQIVHPKDEYGYWNVVYKNMKTPVEIYCKKCGDYFNQNPVDHLAGRGCKKCGEEKRRISRTSDKENFIIKVYEKFEQNRIHYNYIESFYINSATKIWIHCNICGNDFEQTPDNHLSGKGCPFCKLENQRRLNAIRFEEKYDIATIYLLKCFNEFETFLKIGITSKTVDERYNHKKSMPYNRETLYEWEGNSNVVVDLEQKIKNQFIYYKPEIMFSGGHSETLHISQENMILEYLNKNITGTFQSKCLH